MPDFTKYPRGQSNPHVPRPYPMPWEARPGHVSLVPVAQRPVEVEPLRRVDLDYPALVWPSAVTSWVRVARLAGLFFDVWRQKVYPVSARSRRMARLQEVWWVRVWLPGGRVLMRGWRQPEGIGGWQALPPSVSLCRWWRGRIIPERTLSVKEAKEIINGV